MNTVQLVVPATADYLRLARLASADAGTRAGLDYEEIDDLRIAVTELCHLLIGDGGAQGHMSLEIQTCDGEVVVTGRSEHPGAANANELSETILAQVADRHTLRDEGAARVFELTKRHRTATTSSS